jgi:hypothetical protein
VKAWEELTLDENIASKRRANMVLPKHVGPRIGDWVQ